MYMYKHITYIYVCVDIYIYIFNWLDPPEFVCFGAPRRFISRLIQNFVYSQSCREAPSCHLMSYGKVHRLAICIYITPMDHSNPMNPALWHAFSCLTFGGGRYAILMQTTCLIITCNKKMNKTPAPFCKSHCVCCPIFSICGIHSWQKENASKLGADTVAWPLGDLLDHTLPCFWRSGLQRLQLSQWWRKLALQRHLQGRRRQWRRSPTTMNFIATPGKDWKGRTWQNRFKTL